MENTFLSYIDIQYIIPYNPSLKKGVPINQRRNENEHEPKGIYEKYLNVIVGEPDRGKGRGWG